LAPLAAKRLRNDLLQIPYQEAMIPPLDDAGLKKMLEANTQRIDDIERIQRITNDAKFCAPEHSLAVELLEETSDYRRILQLLTTSGRALSGGLMNLLSCQKIMETFCGPWGFRHIVPN